MAVRPVLKIVPQANLPLGAISIAVDDEPTHRPWFWIIVILLALLIHGAVSLLKIGNDGGKRFEVQTVDPAKLAEIRKQIREQQLLISRDKSKPDNTTAPEDARFMSDRNRQVEHETRARSKDTSVLARPGTPNATQQKAKPQQQSKPQAHPIPKLSDLLSGSKFKFSDIAKNQQREAQASQQEGGQQYINDSRVAEGDQNMLNTQESVYYSFYARLYDQIGPIWQSNVRSVMYRQRVHPGSYTTVVDVVLDTDGNLKDVRIMQGSGIKDLDQVVPESWNRIGNFPNPPKGLIGPDGYVHTGWTFQVQVSEGYGFQFAPPERNY